MDNTKVVYQYFKTLANNKGFTGNLDKYWNNLLQKQKKVDCYLQKQTKLNQSKLCKFNLTPIDFKQRRIDKLKIIKKCMI